jgi:hypothetical protein
MPKFNTKQAKTVGTSPVATKGPAVTYEGGAGFGRDARSDLYLLAVTNMVSEATFYEKAEDRDTRFADLVRTVALEDPAWIQGMLPWLRTDGFMRSASVVGAAEAAKVLCDEHRYDGVEAMVDGVLRRADEPGEFMAYWRSIAGRSQPKRYRPVHRGVARAVVRLYTERNWLKWDSAKGGIRFADVIEIVHPRATLDEPLADWQSELFKYILDKRHNREGVTIPASLGMLRAHAGWRSVVGEVTTGMSSTSAKDRMITELLDPDLLAAAGLTWEDVLSALGDKIDKKELWKAIYPSMGAMALIRNLGGMDEAGLPDTDAERIGKIFSDPEQVKRSKQFPFRYLAAYNAVNSLRWGHYLEKALTASLDNVPELPGSTLILVDRSGSMFHARMSDRSELNRADGAAIFGTALAMRAQKASLVQFGTRHLEVPFRRGEALLRILGKFDSMGGTNTSTAVKAHFRGHDRVVIVTDEQAAFSYDGNPGDVVPANVPLYTWNLAGYSAAYAPSGVKNRHTFGGLSDSSFRLIPMLEQGRNSGWPWMQ